MNKLSSPRHLPPELFRHIISFLTTSEDLLSLCLTSHLYRQEAERVLYRSVVLEEDAATAKLWAETILNDHYKALSVRALTLRFDLSFLIVPNMMLSTLLLISDALKELHNLKELRLLGHPSAMMHPVYSWILDGCSFSLKVFENEVLPPSAVTEFVLRQMQLQTWFQAGVFERPPPDRLFPPQLMDLEVHASAMDQLTTTRPLQRLHLIIDPINPSQQRNRERHILEGLTLFETTLTTLVIEHKLNAREASSHLQPLEVLSMVAERAPNLTFFSYQTTPSFTCPVPQSFGLANPLFSNMLAMTPHSQQLHQQRSSLGSELQPFHYAEQVGKLSKLEVLILPLPPHMMSPTNRIRRRTSTIMHFANQILTSSPSLQEISLVSPQKEYTFVKMKDNGIEVV
jgi:hypothetical protein